MVRLTLKPFKRQNGGDPLALPTVEGVTGSIVATAVPSSGTLAADDGSVTPTGSRDPNFSVSFTSKIPPPTSSPTDSSDASDATTTTEAVAHKSSTISMSTVVGACVGAFAGAVFLICIGLWIYNRSTKALKARSRAPLTSISRNVRGELERSRSHRRGDPWNKLESGDEDKWAGMETSEVGRKSLSVEDKGASAESVGPMEKLTMFKNRSPSIRTAVTSKSNEDLPLPIFDRMHAHPYNPYGNPPAHSASTGKHSYLGSVDTGGAISWSSEADGSYFTVHSNGFDINTARAISPTANPARQTPPATAAPSLHRWESAEVVTYADKDPFDEEDGGARKSLHNPFFSAQDFDEAKAKAMAKAAKGKEKASFTSKNPFTNSGSSSNLSPNNSTIPTTSSPLASRHTASESLSTQSDNERAILSIIAALDNGTSPAITPEPPRVVSTLSTNTGYSVVDAYSAVSGDGPTEEDVTSAFPLPPHAGKSS